MTNEECMEEFSSISKEILAILKELDAIRDKPFSEEMLQAQKVITARLKSVSDRQNALARDPCN